MGLLLIGVLLLLLIGAFPAWSYSRAWGYAPTGILVALIVVATGLAFHGSIPWYGSNRPGERIGDIELRPIDLKQPAKPSASPLPSP